MHDLSARTGHDRAEQAEPVFVAGLRHEDDHHRSGHAAQRICILLDIDVPDPRVTDGLGAVDVVAHLVASPEASELAAAQAQLSDDLHGSRVCGIMPDRGSVKRTV